MKIIISDERAKQSMNNILDLVLGAIIAFLIIGYLGPIGIQSMVNATGFNNGQASAATGTYTFSANVSNGELVNITNGANVYNLEFNTTAHSTIACITDNCIPVNLTGTSDIMWNQSVFASGNLTAAINGNATLAALLTAANTTNLTTITADTAGSAGNNIVLSDNAAGVASSGLSGGRDSSQGAAIIYTVFTTVMPIIAAIVFFVIIIFIVRGSRRKQ